MIFFLRKKDFYLFKYFELVFFPSFCKLCSCLLELPSEKVICQSCLDKLIPRRSYFCACCGRFFDGSGESHLCLNCLKKMPSFACHRSCGHYSGRLKDTILLYKYRKYRVLGRELAQFVYSTLGQNRELWKDVEIIMPVPLHPKRKRKRGFNQAQVIAQEMARLKGIELIKGGLAKKRNTPPQTSLDRTHREENVKEVFRVKREREIQGKVVMLVDDVYTTGATMEACSLELKLAGAKEVRAITVAQE